MRKTDPVKDVRRHAERYDMVAIALHWLIAVGVVVMLTLGFWAQFEPIGSFDRFQVITWHKSSGVIVIVFVTIRVLWRWRHAPPPYGRLLGALEKRLASLVHAALYFMLVAVPLSGWQLASASTLNIPISVFGLFHWPRLPVLRLADSAKATEALLKDIHYSLVWVLIVLIAAHLMGVLRHVLVKQDGILRRMLPGRKELT